MKNINLLRQRKSDVKAKADGILDAVEAAGGQFTAEQRTELNNLKTELTQIDADITTVEAFLADERAYGSAGRAATPNGAKKPWASFGEQLAAVYQHYQRGKTDDRLYAALGSNENVPAEGGFLIAPEYTGQLLEKTYDVGEIAKRCASFEMQSNRVIINAVDEDSRVDGSRWGGIQGFWLAEAGQFTPTKPKFRQVQLVANKLIGLLYATDEQLEDGTALQSFIQRTFPMEFSFKIDDAVLNGTGAGQPLGVLNSGAVIVQTKDAGQATGTITTSNVLNMWSRLFATSRKTSVWLINQNVEPALYTLALQNPSGAVLFTNPLYTPPGINGNNSGYGMLLGRPVIPVEQAASLSTQGDIILADFDQYLLAKKNEMKADTSIHIAFLTGEQAFRFQLRLDGQPTWKKPLTPKNSATTLSPFIALQTR